MSKRSDIRKLAMQLLYQIDVNGPDQIESIGQGLADTLPPNIEPLGEPAFELAKDAWKNHKQADQLIARLAPKWPTHRQPPVDRAILRLAYHEMVSGHAPPAVAINEAIELAKNFGSENSPAFINGVIDKVLKQLESEGRLPTVEPPDDASVTSVTPIAPTVKPAEPVDTGSDEPTEPEDSPDGPDRSNGSDGQATREVEPQMPAPS